MSDMEAKTLKNRKKGKSGKLNSSEKESITSDDNVIVNQSKPEVETSTENKTESVVTPTVFTFESLFEKKGSNQTDMWSDVSMLIFLYFTVVHVSGALVNHIDDTDETYGYWEPLHFLLYEKGMQTWEYSPEYAIRSYAFIYPVYLLGSLFNLIGVHKLRVFYMIRVCIGLFTASAEVHFISAVARRYANLLLTFFTALFLVFAPGMYFASTAFLPSSIAASLLMHCFADWIQLRFLWAIFWGSLAVLWTGWPFVGLLLLPIGVHMIITVVIQRKKQTPKLANIINTLVQFLLTALILAIMVFVPSLLIDAQHYGKWTSPTLNIAMYNVFNGSGDNLYGIEPISYYLKNLFLTLGLAWPLALFWPIAAVVNKILQKNESTSKIELLDGFSITMIFSATLWIGVLLLRPHKEERFMYPVYSLVAFIAGLTVVHIVGIALKLASMKLSTKKPIVLKQLTALISSAFLIVASCLFLSRTAASFRNYSGYMKLWQDAGLYLQSDPSSAAKNVCVGSEWYQFPSHFFLPSNAKLHYIDDGFKGILPQHFTSESGTAGEPLQPFNDRNEEERSRYIKLSECNYYIGSELPQQLIQELPQHSTVSPIFDPIFSQNIVNGTKPGYELSKPFYSPFEEIDPLTWKEYTFYEVKASAATARN